MVDTVEKLPVDIAQQGEIDPFAEVPLWSLWVSTVVLSLAFIIGLPLNGATVLIFWRRKKLRHLVNFVLLLDCLSHIFLCLVCIPIHLVTVWSNSSLAASGLTGLTALQQVVGNFSNVYSTFLTVSIAILRYRRLCWKKKDKFSTPNAIKWSVMSGCVAVALTFAQSCSSFLSDDQIAILVSYLIKISLILLSMGIVFFCYIRVSQRVWTNAASHEKVMDPMKLKKSRSVHLRATIHSCVQIILVILTLSPHLYEQTLVLYASHFQFAQPNPTPVAVASSNMHMAVNSLSGGEMDVILSGLSQEYQSTDGVFGGEIMMDDSTIGGGAEDWSRSQQNTITQEDSSTSSTTLLSRDNHFVRLIGITINYALLILGTPMAYIASCHRFREQFTSILFSHIMNSPPNSTCQNPHSPRHNQHKNQVPNCTGARNCRAHGSTSQIQGHFYSTSMSKLSGRPFSSPTTTRTATTTSGNVSGITRNSISVSINNTSATHTMSRSMGGSIKSNKSLKRTTSTRRKGSRGLLGTEFIIVDSDSTTMLQEQDLSNSTNPKETPTPSPTMTETCVDNCTNCSTNGGISINDGRRGSIFCTDLQSGFVSGTSRKNSLQTILHNYRYDFSDMGELV